MRSRPEALAVVMPHREDGAWRCRRWRFFCVLCNGPTPCIFKTPGHAADVAHWHLEDSHPAAAFQHTARRSLT